MGTEIHWLAVIAAGVAAFMVGGVWYSALFGKLWMAARGVTPDSMQKGNVKLLFGITFLLDLFMAFILDHVLGTYHYPPLTGTLLIAGGIALGFVIPSMLVNYLYQQASRNLILIDAGHWFFAFLAMGAVLSLLS
ncbi:DUF1761 domain-containing protein [Sphingomonas sp. LB-2]|uniref:DUF1761 domain-containing protein n=1 Tax=Sphingomonas caeni TaxID=2984949 RepID=UPI00222E45C5|nr:DUF1761 domain-containing protein [Sphingomonas caeni]MCW3849249.1 DUF1761 domain-containing protein [Sphingomonas caeni]